jgi:hypothetical protein
MSDSRYLSIVDSVLDSRVLKAQIIYKGGKFKYSKRKAARNEYNDKAKVTKYPKKWEIEHFRRRDEKVTVTNAVRT